MKALSSSSHCCRQPSQPVVGVSARRCMQQPHLRLRQQSQHCLKAVPEEGAEQPPAAAPAAPADKAQQASSADSASRLQSLANTLGSQSAYVSVDEWRDMDKKVNKYPSQRVFNAIGTGGDDFKAQMTKAVADVVGTVHLECISERPSSGGKYVSVRIGPVWVESADQVIQVFCNMRKDERLKWYM